MGRQKVRQYSFQNSGSLENKIQGVLRLLDLDGAATAFTEITAVAQKKRLSNSEYLFRLLQEECNRKEDLRIERWIKQAKFPYIRTIRDYDFRYPDHIDKEKILHHVDTSWIEEGGKVVFLGPSGVGKTHLSVALGLEAIHRGYEARFITVDRLSQTIALAIERDKDQGGTKNREKLLNSIAGVPLLILDEMAYSHINEEVGYFLFQIIHRRSDVKGRGLIITANEPFDKWAKWFGTESQTKAAIDRITENASIFSIRGKSYRHKNTKNL